MRDGDAPSAMNRAASVGDWAQMKSTQRSIAAYIGRARGARCAVRSLIRPFRISTRPPRRCCSVSRFSHNSVSNSTSARG
jgi:hypothetical protein